MRPAVERLLGAISRRERIAVHGDYDVDGITSTVILRRCLELLGGDVVHFIPDRLKDGYGLQPATIERLHADGARRRLGGLRHPGCRSRAAGARPRRRRDHHRSPRARRHAAACGRRHQPEAPRLHVCGQAPCGRRRRAEAGTGAVRASGPRELAAGVREDRRDWHARRRGAARRRESRHCEARTGPAHERAAQGRAARTHRGGRAHRQDDRRLPHRVRHRSPGERRRSHEQPDIATRLLLAADEAMAAEARDAGRTA